MRMYHLFQSFLKWYQIFWRFVVDVTNDKYSMMWMQLVLLEGCDCSEERLVLHWSLQCQAGKPRQNPGLRKSECVPRGVLWGVRWPCLSLPHSCYYRRDEMTNSRFDHLLGSTVRCVFMMLLFLATDARFPSENSSKIQYLFGLERKLFHE